MTLTQTPFALTNFRDRDRLNEIITNPAYDSEGFVEPDDETGQVEHLERFGGYAHDFFYNEVMEVASRLQSHTEQFTGLPSLSYDVVSDLDGVPHGVTVSIYLSDLNAYLSRYIEGKRLMRDRTASGFDAATQIAEALGGAYYDLIESATQRGLVGHSPADRVRQVASAEQVAIHYQDRGVFEADLGRPLADDEWAKVAEHLDGYDEWLDNSGASESISTWRGQMIEKAGVAVWCDECGAAMFTTPSGVAHHYNDGTRDHIDHAGDADHVPYHRPQSPPSP